MEQRAKNIRILRDFYSEEVDLGVKHTEKLLRKDYLAFEPIYLTVIAPDESRRMKLNVEKMLECAKAIVDKPDDLEKVVEENLKSLIQNDSLGSVLRKRHEHYEEMRGTFRKIFKSRIKMYAKIIKNGVGETYKDIATSSIPTKEEALEMAHYEINIEKEMVAKLPKRDYRNMISVPGAVKIELLEIMKRVYDYAHGRMLELIGIGYD